MRSVKILDNNGILAVEFLDDHKVIHFCSPIHLFAPQNMIRVFKNWIDSGILPLDT